MAAWQAQPDIATSPALRKEGSVAQAIITNELAQPYPHLYSEAGWRLLAPDEAAAYTAAGIRPSHFYPEGHSAPRTGFATVGHEPLGRSASVEGRVAVERVVELEDSDVGGPTPSYPGWGREP